jgi:hypothetical protein
MKEETNYFLFIILLIVSTLNGKSMFAATHSDINCLKSGHLHLTGQPNSQKGRSAKVKDGIISGTKF